MRAFSTAFLLFLSAALPLRAASFQENFLSNPLAHGWRIFGNTNLFQWNPVDHNLKVTWDSSQTNSYFQLPLGTILTRDDDFSFALDVFFEDIQGGVDSNNPSTFELAFGLQNPDDAEQPGFFRGSGAGLRNLVEFDFFPDTGFGPTIWPICWSTNAVVNYNGSGDYTLAGLPIGVTVRIAVSYSSSSQTLTTTVSTNGVSMGPINPVPLSANFTDFRAGVFAIESYSDAGQPPPYGGSLLAHGSVESVTITTPPLPVQNLSGGFSQGAWQAAFLCRSNWIYTLERTQDFFNWTAVSPPTIGNGGNLVLSDTNNTPASSAFYRIRAERP